MCEASLGKNECVRGARPSVNGRELAVSTTKGAVIFRNCVTRHVSVDIFSECPLLAQPVLYAQKEI